MERDVSLGELAVRFGLELEGDPGVRVAHVATLTQAEPGTLAFLANPRYRRLLPTTRASAVVLAREDLSACKVPALISDNPYLAYARIAAVLHPEPAAAPGVHRTAVVSPRARIAATASVGPLSVIEEDVELGERVAIGAGCVLMRGARVGADTRLVAHVSLYPGVAIGARCLLHAGAVIGADGFGFAPDAGKWVKVPQLGSVRIGDDVEIGASTTIDRGAIEDTVVGDGVKLDNQIQVGHNVAIGEHTAIAACTGISGSTTVGRRCMIGGMVGIGGHLTIADDVAITGCSMVSASLREPGSYSGGIPVETSRIWRRMVGHFKRSSDKER